MNKEEMMMALAVVAGAVLTCPFGTMPGQLMVTSQFRVLAGGRPVATLRDYLGIASITGFGMCTSLANPQVAAATAAALGVLTPQPCVFQPAGTWVQPGVMPMAGGIPCLCSDSKIVCALGAGMVSVADPGQAKVVV